MGCTSHVKLLNNYYEYYLHLQALEEKLKINMQVSSYMPFRFQSTDGSRGPLLKIATDPENEGAESVLEPLDQEVAR